MVLTAVPMTEALMETPASDAGPGGSGSTLFVSSSLDTWTPARPECFASDVQLDDIAYRRLDPEYYAWLRSRMLTAKRFALGGQLSSEAFDTLRNRFNQIHLWAMANLDRASLSAAVRASDVSIYRAPAIEHPITPRATQAPATASPEALAMVDAIREQSLGLGWKQERLYTAGKPLNPLCGLAAYLNAGDRIGEVTREAIEIILPSGVHQRFYNHDVEQPWVRRVTGTTYCTQQNIVHEGLSKTRRR